MGKKEDKKNVVTEELSNEALIEEMDSSRFEKEVIKQLEEKGSKKERLRETKRAYNKAVATVKVQIATIESKILEFENDIEDARETLRKETFNKDFDLNRYDNAKRSLDNLEETLEDLKYTLENRQELLVQWK